MRYSFRVAHEERLAHSLNVKQKLAVSRFFHYNLADLHFINIPKADDPWSISQRIAWQKENLPQNISKEAFKILEELISKITLKENYNRATSAANGKGFAGPARWRRKRKTFSETWRMDSRILRLMMKGNSVEVAIL